MFDTSPRISGRTALQEGSENAWSRTQRWSRTTAPASTLRQAGQKVGAERRHAERHSAYKCNRRGPAAFCRITGTASLGQKQSPPLPPGSEAVAVRASDG